MEQGNSSKKPILSNPDADERTQRLYAYLCEMHGKKILSGQQERPVVGADGEMDYIKEVTGKLPAIRGLDYIQDDFAGVNERARKWWQQGGIVTICWHWGIPSQGLGYPSSQETIDVEEALTQGTALYEGMLRQMDRVAEALKELQDWGIPVLWRPMHEFDGQWFWWGKGGSRCFIRLWRLMYERYTKLHGLNNLIWVCGYSGEMKEGWYPGNEYCDIVGVDTYSPGPHKEMYDWAVRLAGEEIPIAYHECGPMPKPEELLEEKAWWSWFMTWHTIHIREQNTPEELRAVYSHDYVVTLDKLPDLR